MNIIKAITVLMIVATVAINHIEAAVVNITQGSTSGYTMTDGNTYVIQNSVSFSNSTTGGSGMTVADNATVVMYVPAGVTLTATGTNGSGRTGGGAGIRVPQTSTLIITGEGTVNASGGNAGNGGNGANGGNGSSTTARYVSSSLEGKGSSGQGGAGGSGGGGAGSAIGGNGSLGGSGGNGASARSISSYVSLRNFSGNGNNGAAGSSGQPGVGMGRCYIIGQISVLATGGTSGKAGSSGGYGDWVYYLYSSGTTAHFATSGGGGGGGGGGGSSAACAIGGGGPSGGGGGGGGSGATAARNNTEYNGYPLTNAHGGGGTGGGSTVASGKTGAAKEKTRGGYFYYSTGSGNTIPSYYYGGDGGAGGAAGSEGGAGSLYVSPTAIVNVERAKLSATTHSAAEYTIVFNTNGGQFSSEIDSLTATLGCALPDCILAPTRRGYLFDGWRTATDEEYYGGSGEKRISSYPVADNVILYAQWHWDDNVDYTVTTPDSVPYSYFDMDYPELLAKYAGDYEAAARAIAANGCNKVWECYVAGISPTNETARFTAMVEIEDGVPVVTWEPNLNTNGVVRAYKVYGSETLNGGGEWQYPTNSLHRFFKVTVEMP